MLGAMPEAGPVQERAEELLGARTYSTSVAERGEAVNGPQGNENRAQAVKRPVP
jgi:hypothetical protein